MRRYEKIITEFKKLIEPASMPAHALQQFAKNWGAISIVDLQDDYHSKLRYEGFYLFLGGAEHRLIYFLNTTDDTLSRTDADAMRKRLNWLFEEVRD